MQKRPPTKFRRKSQKNVWVSGLTQSTGSLGQTEWHYWGPFKLATIQDRCRCCIWPKLGFSGSQLVLGWPDSTKAFCFIYNKRPPRNIHLVFSGIADRNVKSRSQVDYWVTLLPGRFTLGIKTPFTPSPKARSMKLVFPSVVLSRIYDLCGIHQTPGTKRQVT